MKHCYLRLLAALAIALPSVRAETPVQSQSEAFKVPAAIQTVEPLQQEDLQKALIVKKLIEAQADNLHIYLAMVAEGKGQIISQSEFVKRASKTTGDIAHYASADLLRDYDAKLRDFAKYCEDLVGTGVTHAPATTLTALQKKAADLDQSNDAVVAGGGFNYEWVPLVVLPYTYPDAVIWNVLMRSVVDAPDFYPNLPAATSALWGTASIDLTSPATQLYAKKFFDTSDIPKDPAQRALFVKLLQDNIYQQGDSMRFLLQGTSYGNLYAGHCNQLQTDAQSAYETLQGLLQNKPPAAPAPAKPQ